MTGQAGFAVALVVLDAELAGLDLPVTFASGVFAGQRFLLAVLFGWLGLRLIDLSMAVYTNSELLRQHRNLSDMIVPVSMRLSKALKTSVRKDGP